MTVYKPRDGSVAQRVIWFLEQHGASSTADIADGVEDIEARQLHASLSSPVTHGALFSEKRDGVTWYDVKPFGTGRDAEKTPVAPAPSGGMRAVIARDVEEATAKRATATAPKRAATNARAFRCGHFSDGSIVLELSTGVDVVLASAEAQQLTRLLVKA